MNKYKHWLKINGEKFDENKQYQEIETYLKKHPEAKATIYLCENAWFDRIVELECNENYDDLDMTVNSGFNSLKRLTRKPKGIYKPEEFCIPKRLLKFI